MHKWESEKLFTGTLIAILLIKDVSSSLISKEAINFFI